MISLLIVLGVVALTGVIGWRIAQEASTVAQSLRQARKMEMLRQLLEEQERQRRAEEVEGGIRRLQHEARMRTVTR